MYRALAFFLCAYLLVGLPARAVASNPSQVQAEHLAVLFILDDSGSMKVNDPNNLRYTAAALFVSALDTGDRVGALRFSTGSQPITQGLIEIISEQDKAALIGMLQPAPSDGYTDMKAAFDAASSMMGSANLESYRTVVVFLTDGKPEVPDMPASYKSDALAAARALEVPIYAIALTQEGQTAFLSQVAAETGGQLVSAQRAEDLLDSYLSILGALKDRTVLGRKSSEVQIDEGLAPYIRKATFIAVHSPGAGGHWVEPDGTTINTGTLGAALLEDERFTAVTVTNPTPGNWLFLQDSGAAAQVRAVLHARLRAKVTAPVGISPTGQPVTITAELIEEQADGSQLKILGEASFNALVILPDGSQESLDLFYDDGTHGDLIPEDGTFSRLYPNIGQPGTYQVELFGKKGPVPVRASARFEAVIIPMLVVDQPDLLHYELHGEQLPFAVHLESGNPEQFEGTFAAHVTSPSGEETVIPMNRQGMSFSGNFIPFEDGEYTVRYLPDHAEYLRIPYIHTASATFQVRVIPTITIRTARLALDRDTYETNEAQGGIPVELSITSTSRHSEVLQILPVNLPGFTIREQPPYSIPPGESKLMLHLVAEPGIPPGDRQLSLKFLPDSGPEQKQPADMLDQSTPIAFSVFSPAITFEANVLIEAAPDRCWQSPPMLVALRMHSTSVKPKRIHLRLEGMPGAALSQASLEVPPGSSEVFLEIRPEEPFQPGIYSGHLIVDQAQDNVDILPGSLLPLVFTVDSPLQACRTPMIFSGFGMLTLAMIFIKVRRVIRMKTQPPLVKGTLQHWRKDKPAERLTIDLTALSKEVVTIGCSAQCEVVVPDAGLDAEHARISAEKDADGAVRWMLTPLGPVSAGYRMQNSIFELQEQIAYQMGEQVFTFLRDAEL